jgi:hypothetical protein
MMPCTFAPTPNTPFQALVDPTIRLRQTVAVIEYWVRRANKLEFVTRFQPQLDTVETTFFLGKAKFLQRAFGYIHGETDDLNEKCDELLNEEYSIRSMKCAFQRVVYSSAIKGQSCMTGSNASPLNEFRRVSTVLRTKKNIWRLLSCIKPGYQRGGSK